MTEKTIELRREPGVRLPGYILFCISFIHLLVLTSLDGPGSKTRKANLMVLLITAFSWFILGIWYGWGFCFCTEWHYQVRMKLGYFDMPSSYVKFLIDSVTGLDVNSKLVDMLTLIFSYWL